MADLSTRPAPAPTEVVAEGRRRLPTWTPWVTLAACAALAAAVFAARGWSTPGFVILTALLHVVAVLVLYRTVEGARAATDRFVTTLVTGAFLLALLPLVSVAYTVIERGSHRFDVTFFTYSMVGIVGAGGGAIHAIVGTLIVTAIATIISVPIGLLTAVYLVEYGRGRLSTAITFLVDVMTGIPSIVAGLFAFALFTLLLGPGARLGIMGAVALSVLMIPLVVRSSEEILKLVPNDLREAAYALGVPKWLTIVKVVLRTSVAGIATGVTLAIARIIGETAPLLITMGAVNAENFNPFSDRMAALPVFAWFSYTQPTIPPGPSIDRAWTAALLLVILVMVFNLVARVISRVFSPRTR
jgi:phosphate transport system permease protein